jgi:hypothetical protein
LFIKEDVTALKPKLLSPLRYSSLLRIGGSAPPQRRLLICRQTSTVHLYSPRLRRRYRRSILTAVIRSSFLYFRFHHYERLLLIITRDYTSLLREITLHCYERLHFIVTRDYTSLLREITLHCYERSSI